MRFLTALVFSSLVTACTNDAMILGPTAEVGDTIEITVGETITVDVYRETTGLVDVPYSCDSNLADELRSSDNGIVAVLGLAGRGDISITDHDSTSSATGDIFMIYGVSEGDVTLHSICGGAEGSIRVHVRAR